MVAVVVVVVTLHAGNQDRQINSDGVTYVGTGWTAVQYSSIDCDDDDDDDSLVYCCCC